MSNRTVEELLAENVRLKETNKNLANNLANRARGMNSVVAAVLKVDAVGKLSASHIGASIIMEDSEVKEPRVVKQIIHTFVSKAQPETTIIFEDDSHGTFDMADRCTVVTDELEM